MSFRRTRICHSHFTSIRLSFPRGCCWQSISEDYVRYLRVHSLLIILCRSFSTKQLKLCIGTWAGLRKPFIQMKQPLSSRQCLCCTSDLKMNLRLLHIAKKSEEISNLHLRFVSGAYCVEKWEMFSMSRVQQYHQKNG